MSEDFSNEACAADLDNLSAQCPRGRRTFTDGEEFWASSSSPSYGTALNDLILSAAKHLPHILAFYDLTFFDESPRDAIALAESCLNIRGEYSVAAHRREYWKIISPGPGPVAAEINKKAYDRARYQRKQAQELTDKERRWSGQLRDWLSEDTSGGVDPSEELLAQLTRQNWMELLGPKEQLALERMLNDEPLIGAADKKIRQRVKQKIKESEEAMNAAVANDLADLKMGQRMQGETLDEILKGVEALRSRDLEAIDDEDDSA
jgi:hypothetical protein